MLDVQAGVEIYIAAWAGPSFANTHTHARVNTCLQLLSELCDTVALTRTDASTILGAKQHSQSTTAGIEPRSTMMRCASIMSQPCGDMLSSKPP